MNGVKLLVSIKGGTGSFCLMNDPLDMHRDNAFVFLGQVQMAVGVIGLCPFLNSA
jgi:hypothetical protein